jgi:hypothetical protein
MPLSIREVLAGDPGLKYGPSVWGGVNCVGHASVDAAAGLLLAALDGVRVVDAVVFGSPQAERARIAATAVNQIAGSCITEAYLPRPLWAIRSKRGWVRPASLAIVV